MIPDKMYVSSSEEALLKLGLREGLRIDGRSLLERRHISIHFGLDSQCLICLGKTKVVVNLKITFILDSKKRQSWGKLYFSIDANSIPQIRAPNIDLLTKTLKKSFIDSKAINLKTSVSRAKVHEPNINMIIRVIEDDGNLIDAGMLATLGAFLNMYSSIENEKQITLHLSRLPISSTFVTFKEHKTNFTVKCLVLVDPNIQEEIISSTLLTVVTNMQGKVTVIENEDKLGVKWQEIFGCINLAVAFVKLTLEVIRRSIKNDYKNTFGPNP